MSPQLNFITAMERATAPEGDCAKQLADECDGGGGGEVEEDDDEEEADEETVVAAAIPAAAVMVVAGIVIMIPQALEQVEPHRVGGTGGAWGPSA